MSHHDPEPVDGRVGAREAPQSSEGTASLRTHGHPLQRTQRKTNTSPSPERTPRLRFSAGRTHLAAPQAPEPPAYGGNDTKRRSTEW